MKKAGFVWRIFLASSLLFIGQIAISGQSSDSKLIWSDEFDGTGIPDPNKWDRPEYERRDNVNGPDGFWSREDSYLDGNGHLIIRVRKIKNKNNDNDTCDYSVGAVRTLGHFEQLYGKFEIRCQLPKQQGWWVAFWMMQGNQGSIGNGGVDGSEVDIFEAWGWTDRINHAIHWDGYGSSHKSVGKDEVIPGIRDGFHTYTLEWYPEMYIFYVDGVETWRTTGGGVCNQPGYVKITGEISTEDWAINDKWSNSPYEATYPDSMVVDYVRVYEIGDYVEPTTVSKSKVTGNIRISPNPVKDCLNINWPENLLENNKPDVFILNPTGQIRKSFTQVRNFAQLAVDDLSKGFYILEVRSNGSSFNQKFIKN